VFKAGTTQAGGTAMIFRPSYKVKNVEGYNITLEDLDNNNLLEHRIWLVGNNSSNYVSALVKSVEKDMVVIEYSGELSDSIKMLIDLGPEENIMFGEVFNQNKTYYSKNEQGEYEIFNPLSLMGWLDVDSWSVE
jgi:hypothetical protein